MAYTEITNRRTRTATHWLDSLTGQSLFETCLGTRLYYGGGLANTVDMRPRYVSNTFMDGWYADSNDYHFGIGKFASLGEDDGWIGFGGREGSNYQFQRLVDFGYMHIPSEGAKAFTSKAGSLDYNRGNLQLGGSRDQFIELLTGQQVHVLSHYEWSGVLDRVDLRFQTEGGKLKTLAAVSPSKRDELLNDPPPIGQQDRSGVYALFELESSGGSTHFYKNGGLLSGDYDDEDGIIEQRTLQGEFISRMKRDTAFVKHVENNSPKTTFVPLVKRFFTQGNKRYLAVGMTWADFVNLPAGEVVFDPTFDTQPAEAAANDTYINANAPTVNYDTDFNLKTGQGNTGEFYRTLLKFDCSSIPAGSTVNSAIKKLHYGYADNPASRPHSAYPVIRVWVEAQATWNVYATASNWGTAGCANTTTDRSATAMATWVQPGSFPVNMDITLDNAIVATWCGVANNGMLLRMDSEATTNTKSEWGNARDGTAANRPRLVVDYTEAAAGKPWYAYAQQ